MPVLRPVQRSPLHDLRLPLRDRQVRCLAREGWTVEDVRAVQELCGGDPLQVLQVLQDVEQDVWPDRTPGTVLAWLRAGGRPLLEALRDPAQRPRQVLGMESWSRTFGELGPPAHAAGLGLQEATHLLAEGRLTPDALRERAAGRAPAALRTTWSDVLRGRALPVD